MSEHKPPAPPPHWHPTNTHARLQVAPPFQVVSSAGAKLTLANGKQLIDTLSSWWCKSFGHSHPELKQSLITQANTLDHLIFANTRHESIDALSTKLSKLHHEENAKVFYTSEGSSAIEVALKLCTSYSKSINPKNPTKFLCLKNGYHGETMGAMSVSDMDLYKADYEQLCFPTDVLDIPYHTHGKLLESKPPDLTALNNHLQNSSTHYTALILEPLVQGAAGMQMYHPETLSLIAAFAKNRNIPIIADEIMTGMGRCGATLACSLANIQPDIICLSKGLTGGWMPFSATIIAPRFYEQFTDKPYHKSFLHSHTYCGNPLGASLALTILNLLTTIDANNTGTQLYNILNTLNLPYLSKPRQLGCIAACEFTKTPKQPNIFPAQITALAANHGLLLRPIAKTLYLLPPLNITQDELTELHTNLHACLKQAEPLLNQ